MECTGLLGQYSRDWLQIVQIIAVAAVAVVGTIIASQQMQTARNKLKLDLFERRMKVFDATRSFFASILGAGTMSDEAERNFVINTMDAAFLFDDEIAAYLETARKRGLKLKLAENQLESERENREELARRCTDHMQWFYDEFARMRDHFRPFLQLLH